MIYVDNDPSGNLTRMQELAASLPTTGSLFMKNNRVFPQMKTC